MRTFLVMIGVAAILAGAGPGQARQTFQPLGAPQPARLLIDITHRVTDYAPYDVDPAGPLKTTTGPVATGDEILSFGVRHHRTARLEADVQRYAFGGKKVIAAAGAPFYAVRLNDLDVWCTPANQLTGAFGGAAVCFKEAEKCRTCVYLTKPDPKIQYLGYSSRQLTTATVTGASFEQQVLTERPQLAEGPVDLPPLRLAVHWNQSGKGVARLFVYIGDGEKVSYPSQHLITLDAQGSAWVEVQGVRFKVTATGDGKSARISDVGGELTPGSLNFTR
ncbi:hypothetical protein [Caulobacter soli]|uniref:hypothetical protein n=1 Tax=Caulobacter soli TaxID=2708539 RepID=UPI0013ECAE4C|nr:hypothetical protein [Caulobacter soli]